MTEHEESALNRSSEDWAKRQAEELGNAAARSPSTGPHMDSGCTIEELLGKEVRDAIFDDVVP